MQSKFPEHWSPYIPDKVDKVDKYKKTGKC